LEFLNIKERPYLIPQVARWYYDEWGRNRSRSYDSIVQDIEDCGVGDFPFILVAMENADLIGTASLRIHDMDIMQELTPWIAGVYVPTTHRARKIASSLVSHIELRAKALGFEKAYLYTRSAFPLYEKLDWKPMQELEYHGSSVVVMEKYLKQHYAT